MMNSIDDINVTSYGIHVLLLSIFHLVVKVGGCVAEENNFNMNTSTYGLVHYNLDNRLLKDILHPPAEHKCILSSSRPQGAHT